MKLSLRTHYACRALIALAKHPGWVSSQVVADQERIPKRFLERILLDLRAAKMVESRRGASGGYRLRGTADRINLAEVIRHFEGALALVPCVSQHYYERCSCPDEAQCGLRIVMVEVREAVVRALERVTLATVCDHILPAAPTDDYVI